MDERSFNRESDGTWTCGVTLGGVEEPAKIIVRHASGEATGKHTAAAIDFLAQWKHVQAALAPALFAFYCSVEAEATIVAPVIGSAADVWEGVKVSKIEVFA